MNSCSTDILQISVLKLMEPMVVRLDFLLSLYIFFIAAINEQYLSFKDKNLSYPFWGEHSLEGL